MLHAVVLLLLWGQGTPDLATARQWFEAGKHAELAAVALTDQSAPELIYLVAQSHGRLEQAGQANAAYERLVARPETDPWHSIGQSATLLANGQAAPAAAAAERAVQLAPSVAAAQYQLGLAQAELRDYAKAAQAFEAAMASDPQSAYNHYYAGLSYYRAERIDLMAKHFEAFLRLAPQAPERPQVESIMRTVRGRR